MAFETGTASSLADLVTKLCTFAVANGWTQDQLDTVGGSFALHKTGSGFSIYVSFRWDTATPQHLSVHQALGYTGGNQPGTHPNDSGNGYNATSAHTDTLLDDERYVSDLNDGPFPSYFFFEDPSTHHIYVVVETAAEIFRHFGFGWLVKSGDWTGGEFAYGHRQALTTSHDALDDNDNTLLDGHSSDTDYQATVHCEGLPGQGGTGKWGIAFGSSGVSTGTDAASVARERLQGGFRAGPEAAEHGRFAGSALTGNVAMYAINVWHKRTGANEVRHLGYMPNVRALNIRNFQPKEEILFDGDTWVIFPFARRTTDNIANRTYYSGIAYRKVT